MNANRSQPMPNALTSLMFDLATAITHAEERGLDRVTIKLAFRATWLALDGPGPATQIYRAFQRPDHPQPHRAWVVLDPDGREVLRDLDDAQAQRDAIWLNHASPEAAATFLDTGEPRAHALDFPDGAARDGPEEGEST